VQSRFGKRVPPEGSANSPCGLKHAEPYFRLSPLAAAGLQWGVKTETTTPFEFAI
jgi:hypothetical protein